jgi:hypothetical protein
VSQTAIATGMRQQSADNIDHVIDAKLGDGTNVSVVIPGSLCAQLANSIQSYLIRSQEVVQSMPGLTLLDVSRVGLHHRKNDPALVLRTDNLGVVGFLLTPAQWKEVREIAQKVQPDSRGIH